LRRRKHGVALIDFARNDVRRKAPERCAWMRVRMIADGVAASCDLSDAIRMCSRENAFDEERRIHVMTIEEIENRERVVGWAVIDRQPHFVIVRFERRDDGTEPLVVRMKRREDDGDDEKRTN